MTTRRRALLSVSDKTGIEDFGRALSELGFELLSTGGTSAALRAAGLEVIDVAEVTGHPEMLDGRVKTLHPAVHAGILARRDYPEDLKAMEDQGYRTIDIVAVNLYPFRETIAQGGVSVGAAMKQVDIGGPTMIRAAAKNHSHLWVVVEPTDYPLVVDALRSGTEGGELRRELATKVFRHMAAYDGAIAEFLSSAEASDDSPASFPETLVTVSQKVSSLRYGENPDQAAAFYAPAGVAPRGIAALQQIHGKELSYNNLLDLDGALLSLAPFAFSPKAAVCIVKHTTPCGLAVGETVASAIGGALKTDPTSAFGGIIAVNREFDGAAAEALGNLFLECIVAPSFAPEAMERLTRKKNLRLLTFGFPEWGALPAMISAALDEFAGVPGMGPDAQASARFLAMHGREPEPRVARGIYGGTLLQTPPVPPFFGVKDAGWKVVTERAPSDREEEDLAFAWAAVYGVKSNAILLARDGATLGIGAGQMSRVDSSRLAVQKATDAGLSLDGCALASDAFFPFSDGVEAAAAAGVRAIIQPGGSVRDEEVIAAANNAGIAMVFTGRRLFRH
jgi:phosphoribosylaminoimidazolecarboxamide formyltransferase/IMP cyclohydrolase